MTHPTIGLRRRTLLQGAGAAAASAALPAFAQASDFPRGTVRFILPMSAGGAADASTRPLLPELEKIFKRPVIIENRPGGLFTIGLQALLQAPPDGHTLMYVYNSVASVQAAYKKFDLLQQLAPVTQASAIPMVALAPGKSNFRNLAELLAFGRANPGKLTYSTPAQGSAEHLKAVQVLRTAGVQAQDVPYRSGPEMVNAVIAGEVDFTLTAVSFARMFAPKGQVRVLATMGAQRLAEFPDVQTAAEAGVNTAPLAFWGGYAVHAATPPAIVQQLYEALAKAAVAPAVRDILQPLGIAPVVSASPDDFRKLIAGDIAWMSDVAKDLKLNPPG
jgi:tripartite-type tricarboxylate transporter receptor subunit TctC